MLSSQTLSVPATLEKSANVREAAREFFARAGFCPIWVGRLTLVTDELFMNAVKYGSNSGDSIKVTFSFEQKTGVRCEIADSGASGISAAALQQKIEERGDSHTPGKTSGRGLAIITKSWTDSYEVNNAENGGLTVSFVKKLEQAEPPSATSTETLPKTAGAKIIKLTGEIDESSINSKTALVERFLEILQNKYLILDLADVIFINSAFLGRLASWQTLLTGRGGQLFLTNTQPQVREILALVGIDRIIQVK